MRDSNRLKKENMDCIETLCLDGVEERELVRVEALIGGISQSRHRQRLEVKQLRGRGELLRENEMLE